MSMKVGQQNNGRMGNISINNNYDRKLSIKRRNMTEREIALKELDKFLAKLRKKNGTTEY